MSQGQRSLGEPLRKLADAVRDPDVARARLSKVEWEMRSTWWAARARTQRAYWAEAAVGGRTPRQVFGSVDDEHWLWLNTRGSRKEQALRTLLPGLPDDEIQQRYTGSRGEATLREAWNVYRLVKQAYDRHSPTGPLGPTSEVLDFGCGWGRIIRFFLKDVEPGGLLGIDCDSSALALCRRTNSWNTFVDVEPLPPAPFPTDHFDLIYAYSVFSHLSEESHDRWLDEFRRMLKPGGLLMVSTRARSFIETCAWLRTEAGARAPASHRVSAGAFVDTASALADYDSGAYCFSHRSDEDPPHFGETCIPLRYVENHWTDRFRLLDFIADGPLCPQNFIVVQKA